VHGAGKHELFALLDLFAGNRTAAKLVAIVNLYGRSLRWKTFLMSCTGGRAKTILSHSGCVVRHTVRRSVRR
jgi:hypothetical protein